METQNLAEEELLAQLEQVRRSFPSEPRPEPTTPGWLDRVFGVYADDPTFDEAIQIGKKWREGSDEENPTTDETKIKQDV